MLGVIPNPKKSVTIQFPFDDVKEGIKYIPDMFPSYFLFNLNEVMNIYTFSATETLSAGVYIDVAVVKLSEATTQLDIEIRRKIGAFDTMAEVHNANTHIQNIITLVSNFLGYSEVSKQVLRDKYKAEIASTTTFIGSTEFTCPCGQKFYEDATKKRRAICPHCNKDVKLKLPAPAPIGGCMVIIAGALGILSATLALALFIIYK
jgi:DNA-directed RNA polymerase subunit RPC12/RpoP